MNASENHNSGNDIETSQENKMKMAETPPDIREYQQEMTAELEEQALVFSSESSKGVEAAYTTEAPKEVVDHMRQEQSTDAQLVRAELDAESLRIDTERALTNIARDQERGRSEISMDYPREMKDASGNAMRNWKGEPVVANSDWEEYLLRTNPLKREIEMMEKGMGSLEIARRQAMDVIGGGEMIRNFPYSGKIEIDAKNIFQRVGERKGLERLNSGEDPRKLLREYILFLDSMIDGEPTTAMQYGYTALRTKRIIEKILKGNP